MVLVIARETLMPRLVEGPVASEPVPTEPLAAAA